MQIKTAIALDHLGFNDPEVQMTVWLWVAKIAHFVS